MLKLYKDVPKLDPLADVVVDARADWNGIAGCGRDGHQELQ